MKISFIISFLLASIISYSQINITAQKLDSISFSTSINNVEKIIMPVGYEYFSTDTINLRGQKYDYFAFKRESKGYTEVLSVYKNDEDAVDFLCKAQYASVSNAVFNKIKTELEGRKDVILENEASKSGVFTRTFNKGGVRYTFGVSQKKGSKFYTIWVEYKP